MRETEHTLFLLTNTKDFCFLSNLEVIKSYLHNRYKSYLTGYSITDSILWSLVMQIRVTHLSSSVTFSLFHELSSPAQLLTSHLNLLLTFSQCWAVLIAFSCHQTFHFITCSWLSSFQGLISYLPFWILLSPMAAKQT